MVPKWTGKWDNIPQSGKSQRILNTVKVGEFYPNTEKIWEFYPKYWKREGILANFIFCSNFLIEVYLLNQYFCIC